MVKAIILAVAGLLNSSESASVPSVVTTSDSLGARLLVDLYPESGFFKAAEKSLVFGLGFDGTADHYLRKLRPNLVEGKEGVVGNDYLRRVPCVVDFLSGECVPLVVGKPVDLNEVLKSRETHSFRFDLVNTMPSIDVKIDGERKQFYLSFLARSHSIEASKDQITDECVPAIAKPVSKIDRNNTRLMFSFSSANMISLPLLGIRRCIVDFKKQVLYYSLMNEEELFMVRMKYWFDQDVVKSNGKWFWRKTPGNGGLIPFSKINDLNVTSLIGRSSRGESAWIDLARMSQSKPLQFAQSGDR